MERKYTISLSRSWLVRFSFCLSVFAFSGFNGEIQLAYHKSVLTEEEDSKPESLAYNIVELTANFNSYHFINDEVNFAAFISYCNNQISTQLKSNQKKCYFSNLAFVRLPHKTLAQSSDDDLPHFSV